MSRKKRLISILILIAFWMLIIPIVVVNTVKSDAGMLVILLLFFAVYPVISAVVGILAGKDIKEFWFSPLLVAGLFWLFSSLVYQTVFPVIDSALYFIICTISMLISYFISKKGVR